MSLTIQVFSPCSLELISHITMFFSHNKSDLVGLSATETISRIASGVFKHLLLLRMFF
jgi:hypothetical protein